MSALRRPRTELDALLERVDDPRGEYPSGIAMDCMRMLPGLAKRLRAFEDATREFLCAWDGKSGEVNYSRAVAAKDKLRALLESK